jgi:hypothetical protein
VKDEEDGLPNHFLAKSSVLNESIKSDSILIVVKDYLPIHRIEARSI